jgi:2-methylisocitrate lyase-like PEP mutase family enzyme
MKSSGKCLRDRIQSQEILPSIGVYDAFSASLAARHFESLFLSGFGFAASYYGLPDIGFVAWPDIVQFAIRVRAVAPCAHILVDIDDGFADDSVAIHVVKQLERAAASGVVLEDQARPRRCGHLSGKKLLSLDSYLARLNGVLDARDDIVVVARTDASDPAEIRRRVLAFSETSADAILVDGQRSLETIEELRQLTAKPLAFNQILGGKSPPFALHELEASGASLAILSTPLLFSAQAAIEKCLNELESSDVRLDAVEMSCHLADCQLVLEGNWAAATAGASQTSSKI